MSSSDRVDPVSSDTGSTASPLPGEDAATPRRTRRWGLRTLGCLAIVITALAVADAQGRHTPGTFGCVVLGTVVALYCTVRGIREMLGLEWYRRRLASRPTDEA